MNDLQPQNPNPDYQDRDVKVRTIIIFMTVIVLVCIGTMVGMYVLLVQSTEEWKTVSSEGVEVSDVRQLPPQPRLQVNEVADLDLHRQYEKDMLHRLEWLNKDHKTARVPIDVAMDAVLRQGLPVRDTGAAEDRP